MPPIDAHDRSRPMAGPSTRRLRRPFVRPSPSLLDRPGVGLPADGGGKERGLGAIHLAVSTQFSISPGKISQLKIPGLTGPLFTAKSSQAPRTLPAFLLTPGPRRSNVLDMPAGPPSPLEATLVDAAQMATTPEYKAWRTKYPQLQATNDYDLYRAFQQGAVPDERGHLDDIGKLPNHMTYSTDSWAGQQPNNPTPGKWVEAKPGQWAFQASEWNVSNAGGKQALRDYFTRVEPGNTVIFPDGEVFTAPAQGPQR